MPRWSRIGNNYLVEFYSDNSELFESVAAFLADSFKDEKAGIVIATEETSGELKVRFQLADSTR